MILVWLFFALALGAVIVTTAAVLPPQVGPRLFPLRFSLGWLPSELPVHQLSFHGLVTVWFITEGPQSEGRVAGSPHRLQARAEMGA